MEELERGEKVPCEWNTRTNGFRDLQKVYLFRSFGMKKKKKLTSPSKLQKERGGRNTRTNGFRDGYEEDKMSFYASFFYL